MAGFYFLPNQTPTTYSTQFTAIYFLIAHERIGLMISSCSSTKLSQSAKSLAFETATSLAFQTATSLAFQQLIDLKTWLVDNYHVDIGSDVRLVDYDCPFPKPDMS